MKFAWLDEWYRDAWVSADKCRPPLHGTADFWDVALRAAGHESITFAMNAYRDAFDTANVAAGDSPDVVCVQNAGRWPAHSLKWLKPRTKTVAFCSYAAEFEDLRGFDCVFTSFPWFADFLNKKGQKAVYLPLAFGRPILERVPYSGPRDIPVAFFGGLGERIWFHGTQQMEIVASNIPDFKWWGYKVGSLGPNLERSWQGPAWNADYWTLLQRTKICLNRHGEISKGCGNNMRQTEALGCGCVLLTDEWGEIEDNPFAFRYTDADEAVNLINELREFLDWKSDPLAGQRHILENHCYEHRVPKFLETIGSL